MEHTYALEEKMTTMKQFRWFWDWDDEKEEYWLRAMSNKGWHFQKAELPGFFTFEQGEPKDIVYRLDYLTDTKNKPDYLQLFLDAGWDYKGEMNGWQYFSKEVVDGRAPEIFSDPESKVTKYTRLMMRLAIFLPLYIIIFSNNRSPEYEFVNWIWTILMLFFIYAEVRLLQRVQELRRKI